MKRFDTLGFLAPQGAPMVADPELREQLDFIHVTAVAPMMNTTEDALNGVEGRFPGLGTVREGLEQQDGLVVVEKSTEIEDVPENKTGIILGMQETPYDITKTGLYHFHSHGVRVITPVYQDAEHLLGSGYVDSEKGLTPLGKKFLLDASEVGLVIDISHLGHQTARDVMDFRDKEGDFPVMASHGGVYELFDGEPTNVNNMRNLPWDVLERVAEAKGLVGIYALTFGLSEKDDSMNPFIDQVAQAVYRLGSEAVCIGTDSVYTRREIPEWQRTVDWMIKMIAQSGELDPRFPDVPTDLNTARKMSVIEQALRQTDLTAGELRGVMGENALNFFKRVL